jgi:hypothetical protein
MGRILPMTKLPHHHAYPAGSTDLAVAGLLTVWSSLVDYQEDLVLVGGLVPQFLCKRPPEALPAVTMDVDLGIALGATGGQYGTISSHLQGLGFKQENQRFWRDIDGLPVFVDFLTETGQGGPTAAMVDDIPVSSFPGINRALEDHRSVTVSGRDAYGASQECRVKVCEIGPWLVLKLNAFAHRQQPKDAFDLYQGVLYYDRGRDAAATRFKEEAALNPGHAQARAALGSFFASADDAGPIRCAEFMIGSLRDQIPESDYQFRYGRIANDMADIAGILVG